MSGPGHQWSANHIVEVWETKCKINSKIENSNEKMDLESHEVWCQSLRGHFHAIWIEFAMWVAHLPSQLWWCPSQFAYSFIIPRFFLFLLRCLALNRSIFKFGAVNDWLNATAVCRAADKMNKMLKRDHVVCVFFVRRTCETFDDWPIRWMLTYARRGFWPIASHHLQPTDTYVPRRRWI